MKILGIRQTKAHLSELVRDAALGKCSIVTDNRKPVAMIGPPPRDATGPDDPSQAVAPVEADDIAEPVALTKPLSDAAAFRKALLGAPYPLELDF